MAYIIKKHDGAMGFQGTYDVSVNGEKVGEIQRHRNSVNNPERHYITEVWLENEALADETGYPNEYPTLAAAKQAVAEIMERNGLS